MESEAIIMTKYVVELNEEDYQMIKDCHSKNPSLMKAMDEAKKVEKYSAFVPKSFQKACNFSWLAVVD